MIDSESAKSAKRAIRSMRRQIDDLLTDLEMLSDVLDGKDELATISHCTSALIENRKYFNRVFRSLMEDLEDLKG